MGNRLVVSYALDGTLRKILGVWQTLDLTSAKLQAKVSLAQFQERALDELTDVLHTRNVRIVDGTPIKLSTAYVVRELAPGRYTIDLHGIVAYEIHGLDGAPKVSRHPFAL